MAQLYVVPTPIGNLEDITLRALRVLKEVDTILAEDTRTTARLLKAYKIETPLQSFHMHNEHTRAPRIAEDIAAGQSIAIVTDAGMPGISDPGFLLVRACVERGVPVVCLPGASAAITALVGSGLPCDSFAFEGFLPHKKGRNAKVKEIAERTCTTILYEAPTRLLKLLCELQGACGNEREVVVARELTKIHEEYKRGTVDDLIQHFTDITPLGEIVVIVAPKPKKRTNTYQQVQS